MTDNHFTLRSDLTKLRDKYRDNVVMKHLISLSIEQLEHLEKLPDGEQKTRLTGLLEDNMRRLHKALTERSEINGETGRGEE